MEKSEARTRIKGYVILSVQNLSPSLLSEVQSVLQKHFKTIKPIEINPTKLRQSIRLNHEELTGDKSPLISFMRELKAIRDLDVKGFSLSRQDLNAFH